MHDEAMPLFPRNVGTWDRIARILLGLALFILGMSGIFAPTLSVALRIVALVPIATGAFGWCPLYRLLRIDTVHRTAH
jgi:hypothetical protein